MEKDQKLFDLFRDNEHKLHEYPSADAWRRLEQRLDAHRRRRRIAVYRPIAMAATVILLVGMVALFTWVSHTLDQEKSRTNAYFVLLEDLPPGEGSSFYAQNLALREKYDEAEFEEGDSQKRFHVNKPRQASVATPQAGEEPSGGFPVNPALLKKRTDMEVDYSPKNQPQALVLDTPEQEITADDKLAGAEAPSAVSDEKAARTAPAAKSAPTENPFPWLTGTWQRDDPNAPVFEEWTFKSGQEFEVVSYLLQDGQKKILEKAEVRLHAQGPNQGVFFTSGSQPATVQYELQGDTLIRKENGELVWRLRRIQ